MLEFKIIYGQDGYNLTKDLRENVFMHEQNFTYDNDEYDEKSWHIVGYDKEKVIAAARIYELGDGVFHAGRICVDKNYRKMYIGDTLLRMLEEKAVQLMGYLIRISAQESATGFYEKEGFVRTSDAYTDDGVIHYTYEKDLTKPHTKCTGCGKCKG